MLITLIRHAEVEKKFKGRYIGHTNAELSQHGVADSINFSNYFIQNHQHSDFDAIFCSDLIRCKQTLKPIMKNLKSELPPQYTDILREKSWGRHEGLSYKEICQAENVCYKNFEQWLNILDGEKNAEFIQRINNFIERLINNELKNILIITHAGVIHTFIHLLSKLSFEDSFYIKIPYASFVVLDTKPKK